MARINGTENDDTLNGTASKDSIYGLGGNDTILGGDGSDNLFGGYGDDLIFGGDGDDLIAGAHGADQLYGGLGADTFHYYRQSDSAVPDGIDVINDFQTGLDKINLEPVDADATTPIVQGRAKNNGNDAFTFVESTNGVTPGDLTLSYDPDTGITTLNGYTDAVPGADFTIYISGQVNSADIIL